MSSRLPAPPDPTHLDPLIHVWKEGEGLLRCHDSRFGATEFNPGFGNGRFHPFEADSGPVPTLYGSDSFAGAVSETVFQGVPIREPLPAIRQSNLVPLMVSTLMALRDLKLAQLHGHGLRRLAVSRRELIDSPGDQHEMTRRWAAMIHGCRKQVDGLVWVSRQHDTSMALVLFGDRIGRDELKVIEPPLPLAWGPGLDRVREAAEAGGIMVIS